MRHLDSPCGKYRYLVTTKVAATGEPLGFILGHPSDGPPEQDTAVQRCMFIAKREGYGGAIIVYANALKQPYIADARSAAEIIGEKTDACIARMAKMCKASVRAYGNALDSQRGGGVSLQLKANPDHMWLCLPFTARKHPGSIMSVGKDVELWPYPPVLVFHPESDEALVVSQDQWNNTDMHTYCDPISYERYMDLKQGGPHAQTT